MACKDCVSGFVHEGTPRGEIESIHGLRVYVSKPDEGTDPKGLIVMIPDAFGLDFINNKILADRYAKRGGFLVYLPDFMNGPGAAPEILPIMDNLMAPGSWFTMFVYKPVWAIQLMYHFIPWMRRNGRGAAKNIVTSFFRSLRASEPTSSHKIGAAGFCWGGQYAVSLAHSSEGAENLIDCAFTAHPSFLVMPGDIEAVQKPLSIAVGDNDNQLKGEKAVLAKDILEKEGDHEVVIMPGAKHGFAIRTNPEDKQQMEFAERAEIQALEWFRKWLI